MFGATGDVHVYWYPASRGVVSSLVEMQAIHAFISCRLPLSDTVEKICHMLRPDIETYVSKDVKFGNLPWKIKEKISNSDCLIAILTEQGSSAFVQNEVGMAFALGKPVFAIYAEECDVSGIQPYLSTFIRYNGNDVASITEDILSLKTAIGTEIAAREFGGSSEELLESLHQNGVQGIYPDRSTAFRKFSPIWEREPHVRIVGSSIEGFKRGIGIDARELLLEKLEVNPQATLQILLTHPSFARYREAQEGEMKDYIVTQITSANRTLEELRSQTKDEGRIQWKFFKGAPTCFLIIAGDFMLLNPYLYMQAAYFNFTMIVNRTTSRFDIYKHYSEYHFQRAWDHAELSVDGDLATQA